MLFLFAVLTTARLFAADAAQPNAVVRIQLQPRGADRVPAGELRVRNPEQKDTVVSVPVVAGRPLLLIRPARSTWLVCYVADGWWSPETLIVFPAASGEDRQVPVWRLGSIRGRVNVIGNAAPPVKLRATVASPPNPSRAA